MFLASYCIISMKSFFDLSEIQGAIFYRSILISRFYQIMQLSANYSNTVSHTKLQYVSNLSVISIRDYEGIMRYQW